MCSKPYLEAMNEVPSVRLALSAGILERSTFVHIELVTASGEGCQLDFCRGPWWSAPIVRELCNL